MVLPCILQDGEEENLETLRFDSILRYGKFDEYAVIDAEARTVQFSYNQTTENVGITVPHFWDYTGFVLLLVFIFFLGQNSAWKKIFICEMKKILTKFFTGRI
jgi:hypothetical protein